MKWSQIAEREPRLGAITTERLIGPRVLLVGTTRRDGSARISGVEPLVMDGDLWLSMMRGSAKGHDLARDPRIVLHSVVTGPEAGTEIKLRGTVRTETSQDIQQRYADKAAAELGWRPVPGQFSLFAVDVGDVTFIGYDEATGAQHVARWPAGEEYLRPATTPTSLGPRQPVRRVLAPTSQAADWTDERGTSEEGKRRAEGGAPPNGLRSEGAGIAPPEAQYCTQGGLIHEPSGSTPSSPTLVVTQAVAGSPPRLSTPNWAPAGTTITSPAVASSACPSRLARIVPLSTYSTSSRETRCRTPSVCAGISMCQAHSSRLPRAGLA